jgi:hypothetical protein
MSREVLAILAALSCFALAACGSSNNSTTTPLTAQQYTQFLKGLSQQEDQAHKALDQTLHAKSVGQIQQGVQAFVSDQTTAAGKVSNVTAPANAKAANDQLEKAFKDIAASISALLPQLQSATTPQQALQVIMKAKGPQQTGQELDSALSQLKKLGYTQGS